MVSTSTKGDILEDKFYDYLVGEQNRGELVFGVYPPGTCKIFKKKKYYCKDREDEVEFDIVIEIYRPGRDMPHSFVVFECKNYGGNVPETEVNDFTTKIGRIFRNAVKGILVVTSRLQSGAEKTARNAKLGIVKYDENGLDIIADRRVGLSVEAGFVKSQIFTGDKAVKSLKFSAYSDGKVFGSISDLLKSCDPDFAEGTATNLDRIDIPFITDDEIKASVQDLLEKIQYVKGRVDLERACQFLGIDLKYSNKSARDSDGVNILGQANFSQNSIVINANGNSRRDRFTLAHEIGHFRLNHKTFLVSDNFIESDLNMGKERTKLFKYDRLEFQANAYAAHLVLPDAEFSKMTGEIRAQLDIRNRGHGYIYVDDQRQNSFVYEQLVESLSSYFDVSKQAIEIKFKKLNWLSDRRQRFQPSPVSKVVRSLAR